MLTRAPRPAFPGAYSMPNTLHVTCLLRTIRPRHYGLYCCSNLWDRTRRTQGGSIECKPCKMVVRMLMGLFHQQSISCKYRFLFGDSFWVLLALCAPRSINSTKMGSERSKRSEIWNSWHVGSCFIRPTTDLIRLLTAQWDHWSLSLLCDVAYQTPPSRRR